jgi:hypothetical protein
MGKHNLLITLILTMLLPIYISAQDSTDTEDEWKWEWDFDEADFADFQIKKPTISVSYGLSEISRKDVGSSFAKNSLIELKLGHTNRNTSAYADYIEKNKFQFIYLNKNTTGLAGGSETVSDIVTNNWQFGAGWSKGYGYKIGSGSAIIAYQTSTLNWTRIDFTDELLNQNDERIKLLYDETFRFGTSNETGLRVYATEMIVLEAGYERSIVFERHLFWKWAGSGVIELAANGLLDVFIKEIFKSSPSAGPIVFLVLKSALGYGLYELRQDKMNWPFSSAPPIAFDNVKIGVSFVF